MYGRRIRRVAATGEAVVFTGRLAQNGDPVVQQTGHHGSVEFRYEAFQWGGAVHHRDASQGDVVLERNSLASKFALTGAIHLSPVIPGIEQVVRV
ncbi:hypothetical protein D3C87_1401910 [compost metagenome]